MSNLNQQFSGFNRELVASVSYVFDETKGLSGVYRPIQKNDFTATLYTSGISVTGLVQIEDDIRLSGDSSVGITGAYVVLNKRALASTLTGDSLVGITGTANFALANGARVGITGSSWDSIHVTSTGNSVVGVTGGWIGISGNPNFNLNNGSQIGITGSPWNPIHVTSTGNSVIGITGGWIGISGNPNFNLNNGSQIGITGSPWNSIHITSTGNSVIGVTGGWIGISGNPNFNLNNGSQIGITGSPWNPIHVTSTGNSVIGVTGGWIGISGNPNFGLNDGARFGITGSHFDPVHVVSTGNSVIGITGQPVYVTGTIKTDTNGTVTAISNSTPSGDTFGVALGQNLSRKSFTVVNLGTGDAVLVKYGTTVYSNNFHIPLKKGTAVNDGLGGTLTDEIWKGAVSVTGNSNFVHNWMAFELA